MASHQQQPQQEYVLFFSNFCNYSKEIIGTITRKNIRNAFVFVCVDTVRPLPSFVDRVPLIVSKQTREIFADDNIPHLLEKVTTIMYPPTSVEATPAFGFSAQFDSTFEELDADNNQSCLDMDQYRIITPGNEDDDRKVRKADSSQLEQYIAMRANDMKMLESTCRPNFN